jgi:hypothetical protein
LIKYVTCVICPNIISLNNDQFVKLVFSWVDISTMLYNLQFPSTKISSIIKLPDYWSSDCLDRTLRWRNDSPDKARHQQRDEPRSDSKKISKTKTKFRFLFSNTNTTQRIVANGVSVFLILLSFEILQFQYQ